MFACKRSYHCNRKSLALVNDFSGSVSCPSCCTEATVRPLFFSDTYSVLPVSITDTIKQALVLLTDFRFFSAVNQH